MERRSTQAQGLMAALLTPFLMGLAPIFGKEAIHTGIDPYTLTAVRTCLAALILWVAYGLFWRQYLFIFPAGVLGTLVVGAINGLGSLLYYNGLLLLDNASLAQLLNMLYVIFAMLLVRLYGQAVSILSVIRAILALIAVYLLANGTTQITAVHWLGVGLLIGSAFTYALHVVLSQRVMYEMPAPTMALYAMTFMGVTVLIARLVIGAATPLPWTPAVPIGWVFIGGLTLVTALSRITLFAGVRNLGSVQTILLNVVETAATLLAAFFWLGERMSSIQVGGVLILLISVLLARWDVGQRVEDVHPFIGPVANLLSAERESGLQSITSIFRKRK